MIFGPVALASDPTGNVLLATGDDQKLHMLLNDGFGSLTEVASAGLPGHSPSLAIERTGHFVYAAGPAGVAAFSMDPAAHTLTPIALNLPVPVANATGIWVEPSGHFAYVAVSDSQNNALYAFSIQSDGTLTSSSTTPVATPKHATAMVFDGSVQ